MQQSNKSELLFVDLDQTFLQTDLLHEGLLAYIKHHIHDFFNLIMAYFRSRLSLKTFIFDQTNLQIGNLPYNQNVISYIEKRREDGCKIILLTAADERYALQIGAHFGLFDHIHGSKDGVNLKSEAKLKLINEKYEYSDFEYIGDSFADLKIWKQAKSITVVDPSILLQLTLWLLRLKYVTISKPSSSVKSIMSMMRIHQWAKNSLIFLPMLASHEINLPNFAQSLVAFISLSLMASAVYILNDILDLDSDRGHPEKRVRALASGAISIPSGMMVMVSLTAASLILASLFGPSIFHLLILYLLLNIMYNLFIKKIAVADVFFLAGLYTLRVYAGNFTTGIEASTWLNAFVFTFFLSLGFVKRLGELKKNELRGLIQAEGRPYNVTMLPLCLSFAAASGNTSILIAIMYLLSPDSLQLYENHNFLFAACIVIYYWLFRIVALAYNGKLLYDPVEYALSDTWSLLSVAMVLLLMILAA